MGEYFEQVIQKIRETWNVWVGLAGAAFAILLCGLVFLVVWVSTPATVETNGAVKAVVTRLPAPTFTPVVEMTSTPVVDEWSVDGIAYGAIVEIFDTGGSGLRFRAEPGIDGDIQFIANDREEFQVDGGPVEEDGFVWWYLVSTGASSRRGWAVSSYLQVVE